MRKFLLKLFPQTPIVCPDITTGMSNISQILQTKIPSQSLDRVLPVKNPPPENTNNDEVLISCKSFVAAPPKNKGGSLINWYRKTAIMTFRIVSCMKDCRFNILIFLPHIPSPLSFIYLKKKKK